MCHSVISNQYVLMHLDCHFMFSEYSSIYWWNPCKSLDFFSVFLDFTSVYCEICEILNICNICILVSSLQSLCTSQCVLASGEKREGSLFRICICFLKQLTICLFHSFTLYINLKLWIFVYLIWVSDLHLNPQYIVKSWAILGFL